MKDHPYAFSYSKSKAETLLTKYSEEIKKDVTKCIVYGKSNKLYKSWIAEISNWLTECGSVSIKNVGKFSEKQYKTILFGSFGDDVIDYEKNVSDLRISKVENETDSNSFDIDDLSMRLFVVCVRIKNMISPYFSSLKKYEEADYKEVFNIVKYVVDRYSR